jgi:hypothetical protein
VDDRSVRPGIERPRKVFVLPRTIVLATLLALCLVGPAWSQHGGGGGHGGFGHASRGHVSSGHQNVGSDVHSGEVRHRAPFRPFFSLFDRLHQRNAFRVCEPPASACGNVYGVVDCGFWDWRCPKPAPVTTPVTNGPASAAITSVAPLRDGSASATGSPAVQPAPQALPVIWLKDGYSYELAAYWVQDGQLHYRTSYGGENSVPLDRIDFARTAEDNSQRGAQFNVSPSGAQAPAASAAGPH